MHFEPINRLCTGKAMFKDYGPCRPKANLTADGSLPRNMPFFELERYGYKSDLYTSRDISNLHTRIHMGAHRVKGRRMRGVDGLRGVTVGNTYHIVNHDHDTLNREVLIVSTELLPEDAGIHSDGTQRYTCRVSFETQPVSKVLRPALTAHKCCIQGVQCAVVTGPENQEIWTNDHGCVRVQFKWDQYGQYDENSSPWVRMSNGRSGDQFGTMHVPRVGQKILIGYLSGDPNTSVIVGRVPNQPNTSPWSLPIQHILSGVVSKELSGRRRNHLLMGDTQDQIQAQSSSDHLISQLSPGYLTSTPGNPSKKDARSEGFDLRTDGQDSLRGGGGLFFTAEGQIAVVGGHLARDEFIRCMRVALEVVESLGNYNSQHEALKIDTDPQSQFAQAIEDRDAGANDHKDIGGQGGQRIIGAYVPAGMAFITLETLTGYAGEYTDTMSKLNQQYTTGQQYVINGGTGISLSAHGGGWRTIAHQSQLVLQA